MTFVKNSSCVVFETNQTAVPEDNLDGDMAAIFILKGENMAIETVFRTILRGLERESPTILTGLGITGIATTAIMAVRATPKALYLLEKEGEERYRDESKREPISKIDTIKITWKCYLPATLVGVATAACFIGAHSINLRRNAALASLYSITEASLKSYQEKVIEVIGKNKEEKIHDALVQDKLIQNPVSKNEVVLTGNGETLFYDSWSGRYFKSDMEKVRKAQNDLNHDLLGGDMFLSLNSLYEELGLERVDAGSEIGWTFDYGMLEIKFTSKITDTGIPCIVMEYSIHPKQF